MIVRLVSLLFFLFSQIRSAGTSPTTGVLARVVGWMRKHRPWREQGAWRGEWEMEASASRSWSRQN